MSDIETRLGRIEQLLLEGNQLRRQSLELGQQALDLQAPILDGQRRNLEEQRHNFAQAARINEGAQAIQARSRKMIFLLVPLLLVFLMCVVVLDFTVRR